MRQPGHASLSQLDYLLPCYCHYGKSSLKDEQVPVSWGLFVSAAALLKSTVCSHLLCYFLSLPPNQHTPCPSHQLRNLVDMCINPDPEKRPDITYVYDIAKHMQNMTQGS